MIIILQRGVAEGQIRHVVAVIEEAGLRSHVSRGEERCVIGVIGTSPEMRSRLMATFQGLPYVDRVVPVLRPYKFVSMEARTARSIVKVGGVPIGAPGFTVMAGPCAVESEGQLMAAARAVRAAGARILRGERTSRAPRRTISRGSARKGSSCWRLRARK